MIGDRRVAEGELEIARQVELREAGDRGELGERDVAVGMVVQMRPRPFEPLVELAAGRGLGRLEALDRGPARGQRLGERLAAAVDDLRSQLERAPGLRAISGPYGEVSSPAR